jgi:hypothetical protein
MPRLGLEHAIVDRQNYDHSVERLRAAHVVLPTFAELADPQRIAPALKERLAGVDPDAPHPLNLLRVHWFNASDRRGDTASPVAIEVPPEISGVRARIVLL